MRGEDAKVCGDEEMQSLLTCSPLPGTQRFIANAAKRLGGRLAPNVNLLDRQGSADPTKGKLHMQRLNVFAMSLTFAVGI